MAGAHRRLLASAAAVVAVFLVSPSSVPLYDGVGFPDQPYRYVHAPAGSPSTPPPTEAHGRLKVIKGTNLDFANVASAEMGPQVIMGLPPAAVSVLGSETTVDVAIRPVALTGPPTDGTADSNLYDAALTSPAGAVAVRHAGEGVLLTLRAARPAPPDPVIEYRADPTGAWTRLQTDQNGQDTYGAVIPGAGQFLLVQPGSGGATGRSGGNGVLYAFVAVLAGLVLVLFAVRLRSGGSRR